MSIDTSSPGSAYASGTPGGAVARVSKRQRQCFLDELARTGVVSSSARAGGIGRRTAYDWRDRDPGFARAWDDALEQAVDALAWWLQIRGGGDLDLDRGQLLEQLRDLQRRRAT